MARSRSFFWPLLVIAVGVIFLLANTGVLSQGAIERLGDLWPLLLVIFGLQLVFNHTLPRQQAMIVGLVTTAVIVIAAVVFAAAAPAAVYGTQQKDASAPVGSLRSATLELSYNDATVDVQVGNLGDTLYKAHVAYPGGESAPQFSVDRGSGTVSIQEGSNGFPLHLFGGPALRHVTITLNTSIPWGMDVSGGVGDVQLDARELQLAKIDISGGVSRINAQLPAPKGNVTIDVSGGASDVTLSAPAASEWQVSVSGGVSAVNINGSSFNEIGGDFQRQSSGYGSATDRFTIDISGGASSVSFHTG
jgi:hypothetical protein